MPIVPRGIRLLPCLALCGGLIWIGCSQPPEDWAWLEAPLSGDPAIIDRFSGHWMGIFDSTIQVKIDRNRFAILGPAEVELIDARTVGEEIRFGVRWPGYDDFEKAIRLDEESIYISRPGAARGYCGTCTPILARYSRWKIVRQCATYWRQRTTEEVLDLLDRASYRITDWLADLT